MIKTKNKLIIVCILIIILTIVSRTPIINEQGIDSFLVHDLSEKINRDSYASWSNSLLTFAGLTKFSYQAGTSFFLSELSKLLNLEISTIILVLSYILILIGTIGTYVLAKRFGLNSEYSIISAFLFSISTLMYYYGYNSLSSRVLFTVFVPLILLSMLLYEQNKKYKYIILFIVLSITTVFIHRMFLIIFFSAIPAYIFYKIIFTIKDKNWMNKFYILLLIIFTIFFIIQLTNIGPYKYYKTTYQKGYFFDAGTKNDYISGTLNPIKISLNTFIDYATNNGIATIFILAFMFFVIIDIKNKNFEKDNILLISLLLFATPFLLMGYYTGFFYLPIFCITAGLGIKMVIKTFKIGPYKKIFIFIILLIGISWNIFIDIHNFTSFRFSTEKEWIRDSTLNAISFVNMQTKNNSILISDFTLNQRIRAFSDKSFLPANKQEDIAIFYQKIYDINEIDTSINIQKIFDSHAKKIIDYDTLNNALSYSDWTRLVYQSSETPTYKKIINKYNITLALEDKDSTHLNRDLYSKYILSDKNKIYDNTKEYIWDLK